MNKPYWEMVVRNLIDKANTSIMENGEDYILTDIRSCVEKIVDIFNLDEHFVEEYDEDIDYAKDLMTKRPTVEFNSREESGNIYWILSACVKALRKDHRITDANNLPALVYEEKSYENALAVIRKYVNLVDELGEK